MKISEVELTEFSVTSTDIGPKIQYKPGVENERTGLALTIRTADGVEGTYVNTIWGSVMKPQIQKAAPEYLVNRDPLDREAIWQDIWVGQRHTDRLGLGAIDTALWDLAGNYYGESVSTLLGRYRDQIPSYAFALAADDVEGGLNSPDAYAEFASDCLDEGFSGFKIQAYHDPEKDSEVARAVAERVGDEMALMFDGTSSYETYGQVLELGRVLDELGFHWYEDPMADGGESLKLHQRLARELETPILAREHSRTGHFGAADFLANDALDVVRADVHLDGGITGVTKIATVAESFGTDVEVHGGGPASLQCIGTIRNTNFYECPLVHPLIPDETSPVYADDFETLNGDDAIEIPDDPGLGVAIDWDFIDDNLVRREIIDSEGFSFL